LQLAASYASDLTIANGSKEQLGEMGLQVLDSTRAKILTEASTIPKGISELQAVCGLDLLETSRVLEDMVAEGLLTRRSDGFKVLYLSASGQGHDTA
jgi:hypothetical protein